MTINRISIGKIALEFLHNFNFNTDLLVYIWQSKHFSHIIATKISIVYCWVFDQ